MIPDAAVCDTSVLLRFLHDHADEEQRGAQALLQAWDEQRIVLFLLDLSIYEFINVLIRRFGFSGDRAARDVRNLFDLELELVTCERQLAEAAATASAKTGLSGYDAAFVAAAHALEVPLITADEGVVRAASDVAMPLAKIL